MRQARQKTTASALALALAALASPAAGQQVVVTVDYTTSGPITGTLIESIRNLDEPVPPIIDPATVNPGELASAGGGSSTTTFTSSNIEHRIISMVVGSVIDLRSSTTPLVSYRGVLANGSSFNATAATEALARRQLLIAANGEAGRRHFAGATTFTGGGAVITTDRLLTSRLTGRDRVLAFTPQIGGPATFFIFGTRNQCPTANSTVGCVGGNRITLLPGQQNFNTLTFTSLYITNTVERTLTGGTTFFDVPLTPLPSGAVHALAAQGALGGGQRFLDRLGDHAALVDRRGLWGEIAGSRLRFDATGPLARSAADGMAARLGLDLAAAPGLTLGLMGEYGSDDLAIDEPVTPESGTIERWSLGAHARLDSGRLTASLAAQVGTASIDTSGASDLGAARADYDATTYGVAGRIGVRLGKGPLTITPEAGASWNRWERDGFAESGGPAPLTVLAAVDEQTRLWAGGRLAWQSGPERRRVTLAAYGRAVRVGGDRSPAITALDPQLPDLPLVTLGPQLEETRGEYGASASLGLGSSGSLRIGWDAASDGSLDAHALTATVLIAL